MDMEFGSDAQACPADNSLQCCLVAIYFRACLFEYTGSSYKRSPPCIGCHPSQSQVCSMNISEVEMYACGRYRGSPNFCRSARDISALSWLFIQRASAAVRL